MSNGFWFDDNQIDKMVSRAMDDYKPVFVISAGTATDDKATEKLEKMLNRIEKWHKNVVSVVYVKFTNKIFYQSLLLSKNSDIAYFAATMGLRHYALSRGESFETREECVHKALAYFDEYGYSADDVLQACRSNHAAFVRLKDVLATMPRTSPAHIQECQGLFF